MDKPQDFDNVSRVRASSNAFRHGNHGRAALSGSGHNAAERIRLTRPSQILHKSYTPNGQIGTRMPEIRHEKFDPLIFLAKAGVGRKVLHLKAKAAIFSQGDNANAVFYIQSGRAR